VIFLADAEQEKQGGEEEKAIRQQPRPQFVEGEKAIFRKERSKRQQECWNWTGCQRRRERIRGRDRGKH